MSELHEQGRREHSEPERPPFSVFKLAWFPLWVGLEGPPAVSCDGSISVGLLGFQRGAGGGRGVGKEDQTRICPTAPILNLVGPVGFPRTHLSSGSLCVRLTFSQGE